MKLSTRLAQRRALLSRVSASLLLVALAGLSNAVAATETDSIELRPGVIVDAARQLAYIGQPTGGLAAIDLATGRVQWESRDASWPLFLDGDLLVARAEAGAGGELRISGLDTSRRGQRRFASELSLPEGTTAEIDERLGQIFSVRAQAGPNGIDLTWSETRKPVKGMRTSKDDALLGQRQLAGTFRIDPVSGEATSIDTEVFESIRQIPNLNPGQRLPDLGDRQFRAADGRHIMVSQRIADDRVSTKYLWTLYTYPDGQRLGSSRQSTSYAPFVVAGSQLIVESRPSVRRRGARLVDIPLELRASDLFTGSETWRLPVRDTTYWGPFPP